MGVTTSPKQSISIESNLIILIFSVVIQSNLNLVILHFFYVLLNKNYMMHLYVCITHVPTQLQDHKIHASQNFDLSEH